MVLRAECVSIYCHPVPFSFLRKHGTLLLSSLALWKGSFPGSNSLNTSRSDMCQFQTTGIFWVWLCSLAIWQTIFLIVKTAILFHECLPCEVESLITKPAITFCFERVGRLRKSFLCVWPLRFWRHVLLDICICHCCVTNHKLNGSK